MLYPVQKEYNKRLYEQIDAMVSDFGAELRDKYNVPCDVLQMYMRVLQCKLEEFAYDLVHREVFEGMKAYFQNIDSLSLWDVRLTKKIMSLNGILLDKKLSDELNEYYHIEDNIYVRFFEGKCDSAQLKTADGSMHEVCKISTACDLENLVRLFGRKDRKIQIK